MKNHYFTKTSLFLSYAPFIAISVHSQPILQWQKNFGGSDLDEAHTLVPASGGGFVIEGVSSSNDKDVSGHHGSTVWYDYWLAKFDSVGTIQWQKSYGGTSHDQPNAMCVAYDGGYGIIGSSYSTDGDVTGNHGSNDYWVIKTDAAGAIKWQKSLGGSIWDAGWGITATKDNGLIVVGSSYSTDGDVTGGHGLWDCWVVKLDSSGNIQWQKSLGGTNDDEGRDIEATPDGGYIVAAETKSNNGNVSGNHGGTDIWIVKLDVSGNIQWQKCYGGSAGDMVRSLAVTKDGGYIFTGQTWSSNGNITSISGVNDVWVVRIDQTGNIIWQRTLGGTAYEWGQHVTESADGGFLVTGHTASSDGNVSLNKGQDDLWALKLDSAGQMLWERTFGGSASESGKHIVEIHHDDLLIAGYTASNNGDVTSYYGKGDYWVIKICVKPVAGFVLSADTICEGDTMVFTNQSKFATSYSWIADTSLLSGTEDVSWKAEGSGNITITLIAHKAYCETDTLMQSIYVYPKPVTPVIVQKSDSLFSSALNGNQWLDSSGIISGATQYYHKPASDGTYYVVATDSNGCTSDISTGYIYSSTSIDKSRENLYRLYPNPSDGLIFLLFTDNLPKDITAYDLLGNVVKKIHVKGNETGFDLTQLPKGMYFVEIRDNRYSLNEKIILK